MTKFRVSKRGEDSRTPKTYRTERELVPLIKKIARRHGIQQSDVHNTALYQMKEVQQELRKGTHYGNKEEGSRQDN